MRLFVGCVSASIDDILYILKYAGKQFTTFLTHYFCVSYI